MLSVTSAFSMDYNVKNFGAVGDNIWIHLQYKSR